MKIENTEMTAFCSILSGLLASGHYTGRHDHDQPSSLLYRQECQEDGNWRPGKHPGVIADALILLLAVKEVL